MQQREKKILAAWEINSISVKPAHCKIPAACTVKCQFYQLALELSLKWSFAEKSGIK